MSKDTPKYIGAGQPAPSCAGPMSWLDTLFGVFGSSGTPAYLGAGQPAPTGSASGSPVYKQPPQPAETPQHAPPVLVDMSAVPQPCPLPDPFGGLPFVVIPRPDDD